MFGKDKQKNKLINNLQNIYNELSQKHGISPGDFPDIKLMEERLKQADWNKFVGLKTSLLQKVDQMLARDVPPLMKKIQADEAEKSSLLDNEPAIKGGAMANLKDNPFGAGKLNSCLLSDFYNFCITFQAVMAKAPWKALTKRSGLSRKTSQNMTKFSCN